MSDVDITIGAQDKASSVINGVAGKLGGFGASFKSLVPIAAGVGVAIAGVTVAFKALSSAFDAIQDSAAEIDKLAKTARGLGESEGDLLAFQFAMGEFTGASPEKAADGLRKLQRAVGDAVGGKNADVFERLQIDIASISAQEPVEQFKTIQRALSQVENASERAALAQQLLGRGAADLAPALLANADAFESSIDAASRLSADLSGGGSQGIEAMNDAIKRVSTGIQGLIDQATVALAPVIESIATEISEWLPPLIKLTSFALPMIIDGLINIAGYATDVALIFHNIASLNFSAAIAEMETLGNRSEKWASSVNEARKRAREAAEEDEKRRNENIATGPIDDAATREQEAKSAAAVKTIEQLERQLAVTVEGEDAIRRQEQLAMATNDIERERIALLQDQISKQEELKKIAEDKEKRDIEARAKVDKQIEDQAKERERIQGAIANADFGVQATEGRLLTRGASDQVPEKIAKNTQKAAGLLQDILTSLDKPPSGSQNLVFEGVG